MEERKMLAEAEARQQQHELTLRRLELEAGCVLVPAPIPTPTFRVESAIKLIPKFNENDIESVLISFEKIVSLNSFPAEKYAAVLQAHLTGKALKVFTELTAEECQNYATLKAALLNAYAFAVYPKDIPKLIQNLLSGCPHNFVAGWRVKTRLLHVERLR